MAVTAPKPGRSACSVRPSLPADSVREAAVPPELYRKFVVYLHCRHTNAADRAVAAAMWHAAAAPAWHRGLFIAHD